VSQKTPTQTFAYLAIIDRFLKISSLIHSAFTEL